MARSRDAAERDTQRWLERAVIGLNLCPFAKTVHVKGLVHYAVSGARNVRAVLDDLALELEALCAIDPSMRETTLLIVPDCLHEFLEFNDVIGRAEALLRKKGLEGVIQLASFHPQYRFDGTEQDDVTNFTNRSPFPVIHLLREDSIAQAVEAFPEAKTIYEANIARMRCIGRAGWDALDVGPSA